MVHVEGLDRILREHEFFAEMSDDHRELVAGCASNVVVQAGQYIYREGDPANSFYLIRHGTVAMEVHAPGKDPMVVETLQQNELLNWSWLAPPYRAHFDARAIELTRLFSIDAQCLRGKMEDDAVLGYELHRRFAPVIAERLRAARRQMIDMYANPRR